MASVLASVHCGGVFSFTKTHHRSEKILLFLQEVAKNCKLDGVLVKRLVCSVQVGVVVMPNHLDAK